MTIHGSSPATTIDFFSTRSSLLDPTDSALEHAPTTPTNSSFIYLAPFQNSIAFAATCVPTSPLIESPLYFRKDALSSYYSISARCLARSEEDLKCLFKKLNEGGRHWWLDVIHEVGS